MELLNPRMTVQNAAGPLWLIRLEHKINDDEFIDVQLVIQRTQASLPDVQRLVLQELAKHLERQIQRLTPPASTG